MVGEILRIRPGRRGPQASLLLILVAAGVAGGHVLPDQPAGKGPAAPTGAVELPLAPRPAIQQQASFSRPAPGPRDSVRATTPADPVHSVERPPTPVAPRHAVSVTPTSVAPSAQPELQPWIASSAPLDASPPVRVDIAAVGVTARIGPLGLNRNGTLEVPTDFARAGWYTGRPTPGETGPAIIVAHRSGRRGPGAFWKLPHVQPGHEIVVTRADRKRVLFVIDRVEQHRKDAFPTDAVYGPTPETALRLITCGGPFEPTLGDRYRDNIIVFAHMTGWAN